MKFIQSFILLALLLSACSSSTEITDTDAEINFVADEGVRMMYASNSGVNLDEDGDMLLLYEANGGDLHGQYLASSKDGLNFTDEGKPVTYEEAGAFRAKQLPDGTWISYGYNTTKGIEGNCLTSQSSQDGVTFTQDEGCRYTLQEGDNGRMGVYEFFNDSKGGVVLLYLGDLDGANNVRRAYSTDNGQTFEFTNGEVLSDGTADGGSRSFVDEKTLVLPNGDVLLVAMRSGAIYSFLSTDDGETFQITSMDPVLSASDFDSDEHGKGISLFDPQIIQLADGQLRIYVTILYDGENPDDKGDDFSALVSATSDSL